MSGKKIGNLKQLGKKLGSSEKFKKKKKKKKIRKPQN